MAELMGCPVTASIPEALEEDIALPEGKTREAVVRQRVNQGFFRRMVLSSYDGACCITGLAIPELLVGSHIVPWRVDKRNRTNPRNGLCLNVLHDKAFDRGLIAVDADFRVMVSARIAELPSEEAGAVQACAGAPLRLPRRFLPEGEFLAYHRTHIFEG